MNQSSPKQLLVVGVATAAAVGVIGLLAYNSYFAPAAALRKELQTAQDEKKAKDDEMRQFVARKKKLEQARIASFPSSTNVWQNQYETYLRTRLAKDLEDRDVRLMTTGEAAPRKGQPAQIIRTWSVSGKGTWQNIVAMLEEFQRTPLMHRIKRLDITRPVAVGSGDSEKEKEKEKEYKDELVVHLTIETLSLLGPGRRPDNLPLSGHDGRLISIDATLGLAQTGYNGWTMLLAGLIMRPQENLREDPYELKDKLGKYNPFKGGDYPPAPPREKEKEKENPKAIDARKHVKLVRIEGRTEVIRVEILPPGSTRGVTLSPEEKKLLDLTNAQRRKNSLAPVRVNPALFAMARAQAADMAREGYVATNIDGRTPQERLRGTGARLMGVHENVGRLPSGSSPREMMDALLARKPGLDAMMDPNVNEIGLGWAVGDDGQVYCAQDLSARPLIKGKRGFMGPATPDIELGFYEVGQPIQLMLDAKEAVSMTVLMIVNLGSLKQQQDLRPDLIYSVSPAAKGLKVAIQESGNLSIVADRSVPPGIYDVTVKVQRAHLRNQLEEVDVVMKPVSPREPSFFIKSENKAHSLQGKMFHIGSGELYFTLGEDKKIYRIEREETMFKAIVERQEIKLEELDWWAPASVLGLIGVPEAGPALAGSILAPDRPGVGGLIEPLEPPDLGGENNRNGD